MSNLLLNWNEVNLNCKVKIVVKKKKKDLCANYPAAFPMSEFMSLEKTAEQNNSLKHRDTLGWELSSSANCRLLLNEERWEDILNSVYTTQQLGGGEENCRGY